MAFFAFGAVALAVVLAVPAVVLAVPAVALSPAPFGFCFARTVVITAGCDGRHAD